MKIQITPLLISAFALFSVALPTANACKGKAMILNRRDAAVTFCYDKVLKAFLSEDCFRLKKGSKACEIRSVISRNRFSPVKLSALELQTADNPDAVACEKLKQNLRVLIDSEGVEHTFCESKFDGSLAPLYLFKWRV